MTRIDGDSGRATRIDAGHRPTGLAVEGDTLYVALRSRGDSHVGGTLRVAIGDVPLDIDTASAYLVTSWSALVLTNDGLVGWRRSGGQAGFERLYGLKPKPEPAAVNFYRAIVGADRVR